MKQYELSKIGEFHINHNEDASVITEIGKDKILIAVMDGCSMGKESHFASTLMAKLLRKIGKEISYKAFVEKSEQTAKDYLKDVMRQLFEGLQQIKQQLYLEREEVLSTIILGILDIPKREIELITIGDGLICCNGVFYEYEQDDRPDYLGYHLEEEFSNWYDCQSQKLSLKNVEDISIATDGIFTFKNFDGKVYDSIEASEIVHSFLVDGKGSDHDLMLNHKLTEIENGYGLKPSDDLTIIRISKRSSIDS